MNKLDFGFAAKMIAGAIVSVCTFLFGKADILLIALIAFLVIDYVTGVAAAVLTKELSSRTGIKGIIKKVLFLAVVSVAYIIDTALNLSGVIRNIVIGFLVANEGLSILENCARCGVPLPPRLIDTLKQLKDKANSNVTKDNSEKE